MLKNSVLSLKCNFMRFTFLIVVLMFLSFSCRKEKIIEETKYVYLTDSWQKADEIDKSSKYIISSYADDDKAVFRSPYNYVIKDKNGFKGYGDKYNPFDKRLAVSKNNFLQLWQTGGHNNLTISKIHNRNYGGLILYYDSLPNFKSFGNYSIRADWSCFRSDDKQLLFHYSNNNNRPPFFAIDTQSYALVSYDIWATSGQYLTINSVKPITIIKPISSGGSTDYTISIKSFFNKFFVCNTEGLEIIYGDGTHRAATGIPPSIHPCTIIELNGALFLFASNDNSLTSYSIYKSTDQGENWTPVNANLPRDFLNLYFYKYYVIDNEIVLISNNRHNTLIHLSIKDSEISFKQLKNDGLTNNISTGLVEFDGIVYLSTTSGTYKKSIKNFFEYKAE